MNYRQERESLRRRGISNWNTLSDAAVARMFSRSIWRNGEQKSERSARSSTMGAAEKAMLKSLKAREQSIYLAIRKAAAAGGDTPSYADLEDDAGYWAPSITAAIRVLIKAGALERQVRKGKKPIYSLPFADLRTGEKEA